ncbi:MAG: HD domain-containing protein [Lachnospiraceae bacterium]|nr:HD domain-containing protein [Lachnospiraceae bacterium]
MMELFKAHQLNIMLLLCGSCMTMVLLLIFTQFITSRRKLILIFMELIAFFLLWFDRLAYLYAGAPGPKGYLMVRVSNFMVFFLTSAIVYVFNMYLADLLTNEGQLSYVPKRLFAVRILSAFGMVMVVISSVTNLYYYFDTSNRYHRGPGFLVAYIVPVLCPLIQYTVIRQFRERFRKLIYISLVLYIFVPIFCGILQIFAYGISIVNMSMAAVSVSLYIFTYLDINKAVKHAHEVELKNVEGEKKRLKRLFDQTATAFVSAVEKKDDFTKGNAVKIADYAGKIAKMSGKNQEDCEKIYYAALLHDVGMIGIPDSVIKNEADPGKWDYEAIREKPVIGSEILSSITEYPYLSQAARYSHERYNGTGYPDGLKGEEIPEIARLTAVADAFVTMTTPKRYRDARPFFVAREKFIEGAGEEFDPAFAEIMVKIIDSESAEHPSDTGVEIEKELSCGEYRDHVSAGIAVEESVKRIRFTCDPGGDPDSFSGPSMILFDSYDRRIHGHDKSIREYHYLEYAEIWFDEHMVITAARKAKMKELVLPDDWKENDYEIVAARFEDHLRLRMTGPAYAKEIVMALPDSTKASYIGLTGEHCELRDISVSDTGETTGADDIPRIADVISYTDHLESDIPNIQIDRTRSAYTEGIELTNRTQIIFHTMSLPGANLVWHCPYIVLFYSDDGTVNGENYREYDMIKLNGEDNGSGEFSQIKFETRKSDDFPGWERWKEINKEGVTCTLNFEKRGNKIRLNAENVGISMESTMTILDGNKHIYAALTGDQVALTDIRVLR